MGWGGRWWEVLGERTTTDHTLIIKGFPAAELGWEVVVSVSQEKSLARIKSCQIFRKLKHRTMCNFLCYPFHFYV